MAAGMLVAGTLPGIARPAIATLIPKSGDHPPTVLLDSGANIECHAQQLVQFALMGDCYSKIAISSDSPRVGLLSNGSERSKGTDVIRSAATTLKSLSELNFIGFVEGRDIPRDVADVVVCDGFVGNIVLKSMEGSVELVLDLVKNHVVKTLRGKIGMWLAAPKLKSLFKQRLDPSAYGGAPLLGLREVAIVCHGSSKKRAIKNAVRVARQLVDRELVKEMGQALGSLDSEMEGEYENGMWNRLGTKLEKDSKQKKVPASKAAGQSED